MMFLKGTRGVLPVKGTKGRKGRVKKQRRPQRRDDDCRQPWRMRTDKGWPVHCGIISNIFTIYYFTISIFIKKMAQTDKGWPEAVSITDTEIIDQFYIQLQCLQKLFNQKTKQWNITVTKGFVSNTTIWSVSNLLCLSLLTFWYFGRLDSPPTGWYVSPSLTGRCIFSITS